MKAFFGTIAVAALGGLALGAAAQARDGYDTRDGYTAQADVHHDTRTDDRRAQDTRRDFGQTRQDRAVRGFDVDRRAGVDQRVRADNRVFADGGLRDDRGFRDDRR